MTHLRKMMLEELERRNYAQTAHCSQGGIVRRISQISNAVRVQRPNGPLGYVIAI